MGSMKRKQVRAENGRMGSLHAMLTKYPDERSCERRLVEVRWPDGWRCPKCGNERCSPVADRNRVWQCARCSHQFSITAGTCMQHSKVRLRRWGFTPCGSSRARRGGVSAMELVNPFGGFGAFFGAAQQGVPAPKGRLAWETFFMWDVDAAEDCLDEAMQACRLIRASYEESPEFQRMSAQMRDELRLDVGGCTVGLFRAASPHTDDTTLAHVPDEGVLFFDDAKAGAFPTWEKDPTLCRRFSDAVEATGARTCVGGHWEPVLARRLIDGLRAEARRAR